MSKLQPAKETKKALALEYAKLMDYTKVGGGYMAHSGTKLTLIKMGKLLLELGFITKIKNKCVLDIPKIYKYNSYLHTKIQKPVEVGVQIRLII